MKYLDYSFEPIGSTRRFAPEVNQKADFRLRTEPSIFDILIQHGKQIILNFNWPKEGLATHLFPP